jgi:hypothetical protein
VEGALGNWQDLQMIENDEIFRVLGCDMVLIDKQKLSRLDIPASARDWLATVGIPKKAQLPYGLIFNGANQVEPISKSKSGIIVGESEGPTYIVVREDGVVVLVDKFNDEQVFMNTTIEQFTILLCNFADLTHDRLSIKDFQISLREIDNNAAAEKESFWSVAIEDMLNLQL